MAKIRRAGIGDSLAVEALIKELNEDVTNLAFAPPNLGGTTSLVLLAEEDAQMVGLLAGQLSEMPGLEPNQVRLHALFVRAPFRRRGVAGELLWRCGDFALENRCDAAHVEVPLSMPRIQNYFQSRGFNVRTIGRVQLLQAGSERNNVNDEEPWFSVRCHFRVSKDGPYTYEERVTLWRANDMGEAIERAENEARTYASEVGYQYLDACSCFHLSASGLAGEGTEIVSEMRRSDLEPEAYLDRHFFTGSENGRKVPDPA